MTDELQTDREFLVRAIDEDVHHGRLLSEPSFEAAAIAYVEHMHHAVTSEPAMSIVVQEVHTGHEHRFRIDLGNGEATQQA